MRRLILGVLAVAACSSGSSTGPEATLKIAPDSVTVTVGATAQLSVSDPSGQAVQGAVWSTSDASRATVSNAGLVTTVAVGRVVVTASAGGKSGSAIVRAAVNKNFTIADAQVTQGIQSADGSIPIVLGGNPAVVNVLARTSQGGSETMQLVLRLFDAGGALLRADTLRNTGSLGASPTYAAPTAQFLVPASLLPSVASWQVVRDPRGDLPDTDPSDDIFPRTGRAVLARVTVPAIAIRFVPIVLTAHGNATGQVTTAQLPEYLRTVKSVHPLGAITATVGSPFSTSANFGTPPSGGGGIAFWQQVLAELDLARVSDLSGDPNSYWMGILVPPAGYTFTAYGGFGYIPGSASNRAAGTRTAVGVQLGWFARPTQARDNIAHELGHNFGRAHAPCGGAGSPDPLFPNSGGTIGTIGHDVYSWANGDATSAAAESATSGDLMGYCFPVWISEYTYRNILQFRGSTAASLQAVPAAVRSIVVRGRIENGTHVVLEPSFTIVARPTAPEHTGPYLLTGRTASGEVLFSRAFEPSVLDHSDAIRQFLFVIPVSAALEDSLASIDVSGGGGTAELRSSASATLRATGSAMASVSPAGDGSLFRCADAGARGILVQDQVTGALLGTATAASLRVAVGAGRPVSVVCSDGVRSARSDVVSR